MIRYGVPALAAGLAACLSCPALAADPLPTESHKVLTAALAVEAAEAAIGACKSQGYNVTVTIADRTGTPKLVLVGDGAGALTTEVTRRKAYTAARLRITTGEFAERVAKPGAF